MKCHKCQKAMTMTPVCCGCGFLPIAEGSFRQREDEIARLRTALETIRDVACGELQCKTVAILALSANESMKRGE